MPLLVGDTSTLALESHIKEAYRAPGPQAWGFFVVYVGGLRYGVRQLDATLLGCSYDHVQRRVADRGKHTAPFAEQAAGPIADAYRDALYAADQENRRFFGLSLKKFTDVISRAQWAPDGDEAFDDGSYLLQFDVGARVRVIAFKVQKNGNHHDPATLRDCWLDAKTFYGLLKKWQRLFKAEWRATPKAQAPD